jgi:hypothetical protein
MEPDHTAILETFVFIVKGTLPNYFKKISIIMTLSLGPPPSYHHGQVIPGLEDSDRYSIQLQAKGWFIVHAKLAS